MKKPRAVKPPVVAEPGSDGPRCGDCIFVDSNNPNDVFCRRYPPVLVVMGDVPRQFFPSVNPARDWCGEHRAKPRP